MLTEIQVQNPDLALLPGMYVQVRLTSPRVAPPLIVPGNSILATPQGLRVAILEDLARQDVSSPGPAGAQAYPPQAKRIHLREVQVGRDFGQELEVISGLQGWEYVVVNPGDEIEEGAVVLPRASARAGESGGQHRSGTAGQGTAPKQAPASK